MPVESLRPCTPLPSLYLQRALVQELTLVCRGGCCTQENPCGVNEGAGGHCGLQVQKSGWLKEFRGGFQTLQAL